MGPSTLKQTIIESRKKRQPLFIEGPPGIGKSQIVQEVADEVVGGNLLDFRLLYRDPVDLRGLPSINGDTTKWLRPDELPVDGEGIIFLDEITAAPKSMQACAYQLTDPKDPGIGEWRLPKGWYVVAAGNGIGDRAVSHTRPSASVSRFVNVKLDVNLDDWCAWAVQKGIHPMIIGFLRLRTNLLYDFDPKTWKQNTAFACPRTWEMLSNWLGSDEDECNVPHYEVITGLVGEAAGAEFNGFVKTYQELPTVEEVLLAPEKARVPESPAGKYAISAALAIKASKDNLARIFQYYERLGQEHAVCGVRDAFSAKPELMQTKAGCEWAVKNKDIMS